MKIEKKRRGLNKQKCNFRIKLNYNNSIIINSIEID